MASGEGEVVGEIEGLLGGEEKIQQEVIRRFRISAPFPIVNDGLPRLWASRMHIAQPNNATN